MKKDKLTPEEIKEILDQHYGKSPDGRGNLYIAKLICKKEAQLAKSQRLELKDGEYGIPSIEELVAAYEKDNLADDHAVGCQGVALFVLEQIAKSQVCPECKGEREVEIDCGFEGFRIMPCPICQGTGKYSESGRGSDGFEKCPKCKGTGVGQFKHNRKAPCDDCQGTGKSRPDEEAIREDEWERIAGELRQLAYEKADGNNLLNMYDIYDYADKLGQTLEGKDKALEESNGR